DQRVSLGLSIGNRVIEVYARPFNGEAFDLMCRAAARFVCKVRTRRVAVRVGRLFLQAICTRWRTRSYRARAERRPRLSHERVPPARVQASSEPHFSNQQSSSGTAQNQVHGPQASTPHLLEAKKSQTKTAEAGSGTSHIPGFGFAR